MALVTLPLSEGLEQNGDKSETSDGALTRADNAEYRPNDATLFKRKGRTKFNSSAEVAAIRGCVALIPITTTPVPVFLVQRGSVLRSAPVGVTGVFSDAVTGLAGTSEVLARAHLDSHFVIGNGVDRNRVYGPDFPSFGLHGMLAAVSPPTISRDAGVGTGFVLNTGVNIQYWVEERVKVAGVIVKRSASALAQVATLVGDGSTDKPVLTRPATLNSDSTHWALYGTSANGEFPIGAEIAEVVIGTTTIEDTRTGSPPDFPAGETYETVNVTLASVRINTPLHGAAPIFDTVDVFEDSLCINDKANQNWLWFSFTREPHAFPATNVIFLGDGEVPGKITLIRQLGQVLVVCLENQVWVIFQLPHPGDKLFQIERVKQKVEGALGCVGPLAGDRFVLGDREFVAWVSHEGVMMTDGNSWDLLSDDLDWEALIEPTRMDKTVLTYNPRMYRLELTYTPLGGTTNTKTVYLSTHPSHLKRTEQGLRPKVTGPCDTPSTSGFSTLLSGRYEVFVGTTAGHLVRTNVGNSDENGEAINFQYDSKEYYLAESGNETAVRKMWVHHRAGAVGQRLTVTATMRNEGRDDYPQSDTIPLERRELTKLSPVSRGASFIFSGQNNDALGSVGIDYLRLDVTDPASEKTAGSKT